MALADEVYAKLVDLELRVDVLDDELRSTRRENEELKAKLALAKEHARDVLRYLGQDYVGPV